MAEEADVAAFKGYNPSEADVASVETSAEPSSPASTPSAAPTKDYPAHIIGTCSILSLNVLYIRLTWIVHKPQYLSSALFRLEMWPHYPKIIG